MSDTLRFDAGDRVAWHPVEASRHAAGSILRVDALPEDAQVGVVEGVANDEGTWFSVLLDGEEEARVLTQQEIVKVGDA